MEILVVRSEGRETVDWVRNLYRYYLAYAWMLAAAEREPEKMRALRAPPGFPKDEER